MAFYDRTVHFREWLDNINAPIDESLTPIIEEIRKAIPTYTEVSIRQFLKDAKLNKYYENISQIKKSLSGNPVILIPKDIVSQVVEKFKIMSDVYERLFPGRSFLSFSFLLYKLVEILKTPQSESCLESLPKLTRSQGKREMQMERWKQVCDRLNWVFIE
jgi:Poxvirus Late Transcription Factor VLTF3 like